MAAETIVFDLTFRDKFSKAGRAMKATVDKTKRSIDKFNFSTKKMAAGLKKVGAAAKVAGGRMKSFGRNMAIAATLPIAAFGVLAVKAAGDAEEMESKLGVVFANSANDMRKWADELAVTTSRGSNMVRGMTADMGDFLKGLKFQGGELNDMTKSLVTLTQDLGSFKNVAPERVFLALQGAMVGNNESLKTLGISLLQAEVQTRAFAMTGKTSAAALTMQEKSAASLALIIEKSGDAQGDAARTSQSFTNQMIGLRGALTDVKVVIGNELLPIITPMITKFATWLKAVAKANPRFLKLGIIVAGLVAVVGPLLIVIGFAITAIAAISAPVLIAIGAITGLIVAVSSLYIWWDKLKQLWMDFTIPGQIMKLMNGTSRISHIFEGKGSDTPDATKSAVDVNITGEVTGAKTATTVKKRRTRRPTRGVAMEAS